MNPFQEYELLLRKAKRFQYALLATLVTTVVISIIIGFTLQKECTQLRLNLSTTKDELNSTLAKLASYEEYKGKQLGLEQIQKLLKK